MRLCRAINSIKKVFPWIENGVKTLIIVVKCIHLNEKRCTSGYGVRALG